MVKLDSSCIKIPQFCISVDNFKVKIYQQTESIFLNTHVHLLGIYKQQKYLECLMHSKIADANYNKKNAAVIVIIKNHWKANICFTILSYPEKTQRSLTLVCLEIKLTFNYKFSIFQEREVQNSIEFELDVSNGTTNLQGMARSSNCREMAN